MSKAKTLAGTVSTGGVLADGAISASEVTGLATVATTGAYGDLSGKPSTNDFLPSQSGNNGKYLKTDGSTASWASIVLGTNVVRSTKTANYTLLAADQGNLVVATSNSFTFAFTAAATLGSGWCVYLQNSGTGNITLDPNASETIDGLTSYVMYPGEARLVQCDGTGFNSVVLNAFYATFTSTATFTKPPGYQLLSGLLWGAGGGGGNAQDNSSNYNFGGGGGGCCTPFTVAASSVPSSLTVTIGAGGAGATSTNVAGGIGGTTSFGSIAFGYGGGGGVGSNSLNGAAGGGGGVLSAGASAGSNNNGGAGGMPSLFISSQTAHNPGFGGGNGADYNGGAANAAYGGGGGGSPNTGGASYYGGGGGGGGRTANSANTGGASTFGGAGGNATLTGFAGTGGVRGGGGGGTAAGVPGVGGRGEAQLWGIL
jgi:hypothetical protein